MRERERKREIVRFATTPTDDDKKNPAVRKNEERKRMTSGGFISLSVLKITEVNLNLTIYSFSLSIQFDRDKLSL